MSHNTGAGHKKAFLFLLSFIVLYLLFVFPSPAHSKRKHMVYFPNTAYELNVYHIYGKQPGKTLMLIGGIQGNEPGGFLSADLYADMKLERGNLIVVPRANFYSILLNRRGPHGDMNRRFAHEDATDSMEDKIVSILKKLIGESHYLLNLHDGSGYYYPEYIDKWRNPKRFGQSIIADYEEYVVPGTGRVIKLGEMAREVIREVNPCIKNELYRFHFNNTRTDDADSPHNEQRKSATYYAITKHHIPAFGVESSKFLPTIDLKVRFHNMVINAFMKLFGIIPAYPGFVFDPPVLKYLVLSINGQTPSVVKDNQALFLRPGDSVHVSHIEANYERGLSLDIMGYGGLNDFRKDFVITGETTLIVRKDNEKFAEIPIRISEKRGVVAAEAGGGSMAKSLVVEARGHCILLGDGETLNLVRGDHMKILDIFPSYLCPSGCKVNFKGFVGDKRNNTGEDRGYDINTGVDLMNRYSLQKKGRRYEVIASGEKNVVGRFFVSLDPPKLDYLILKVNGQYHKVLRPGGTISLSRSDELGLEEVQTNLYSKSGIHLSVNDHVLTVGVKQGVAMLVGDCGEERKHEALIKKGHLILGRVHISVE